MSEISVLFCCLGNICRSPMAEGVFKSISESSQLKIKVDSCGTASYHVGEKPDERVVEYCSSNGIALNHKARQLNIQDFDNFDFILGMDHENIRNINSIRPTGARAKVMLFGEFGVGKEDLIIKDPYYGSHDGFKRNYEQIVRCSHGLLKELQGEM